MANEAYTNVDSPQSLKMFIIKICNRYLSLLQTCPFVTFLAKLYDSNFTVIQEGLGQEKWQMWQMKRILT
jgi:hypothetical protein